MKSLVDLPPALIAPELIKVQAVPTKKVYDFTKRSNNIKLLEEGASIERFEFEEKRCDSRLLDDDLKKLEIELKRKQKRRQKRERRIAQGLGDVRSRRR